MLLLLLRFVGIVAVSSGIGLIHALAIHGLPLYVTRESLEADKHWREARSISLEEFWPLAQVGAMLVVDARHREQFAEGHLDAPLIVNIPEGEVSAEAADQLRRTGLPIVIYCSSLVCDMGDNVYKDLLRLGLSESEMKLYLPGWDDGIVKNNLPTRSGAAADLESELNGLSGAAAAPAEEGADAPPGAPPDGAGGAASP